MAVDERSQQQLPTPDFYEYPWTPIERVDIDGRFATITWADGAELQAFDWWLLENAVGLGFDLATREHLLDPAQLSSDMAVESAVVSDCLLYTSPSPRDRG